MSASLVRIVLLAAAAIAPLLRATAPARGIADAPALPSVYAGRALVALPVGEVEAAYLADFPGRIGRFHDGERTWILRTVATPTLALHGSARCLTAVGFRVEALAARRDPDGSVWSRMRAERGGTVLVLRERVESLATGATWPDVDAWRHDAWLGRDPGPWLAATAIENAGE